MKFPIMEVVVGYPITYLIDVRGADFNRLMRPSHQADKEYFEEMTRTQESDLWDGMLPSDDTTFLVDLTGEWTLCKLPYPYSYLLDPLANSNILEQIGKWEQTVRALLPSKEFIRIDDFLLDGWNSRYDYLMVRSAQAVDQFIEWLQTQDHLHWSNLSTSHQV